MTLLQQAGAAVLLLSVTLFLQCGGAAGLILWIRSIPRATRKVQVFHCAALVMQTTVAVIVLHGIVILLWASCYRWLCFPSWESAFYFSASSYATVGYGDVILPSKWRLLGPLESMVGMLMSGVSIGLLFAAVTHLVDGESRSRSPLRSESAAANHIGPRQRQSGYRKLQKLSADSVKETELAGEPIVAKLTKAPGNHAPIGGMRVVAKSGWFAARPSGTEIVYKIYAETFKDQSHLNVIISEAQEIVGNALGQS